MKKISAILAAAVIAASSAAAVCARSAEPTVKVDGRTLMFREDQPPIILNDRTYVPIRRVLENMDAQVKWNEDTKTVRIDSYDNIKRLILTIDNPEITVYTFTSVLHADEDKVVSDVAPVIVGDRTMLPIRVVAEAMGATVEWDDAKKLTTITTQQAKRYAKAAGIEIDKDDFVLADTYAEKVPQLSLAYDGGSVKTGDTVTLALKLANLEADSKDSKVSSVTVSIMYNKDNFAYDTFRCISEQGEISPALSANNPEFADGCVKIITLSLPANAYLPAEDGTVMEIDFTALNDNGGEFSISDAVSELGSNTELIVATDSETYYSISSYDKLYIDTTPVTVKLEAAADDEKITADDDKKADDTADDKTDVKAEDGTETKPDENTDAEAKSDEKAEDNSADGKNEEKTDAKDAADDTKTDAASGESAEK